MLIFRCQYPPSYGGILQSIVHKYEVMIKHGYVKTVWH